MAAPAIQLYYNDEEVKLLWLPDTIGIYKTFNLYWSADPTMAGEVLLKAGIPNVVGCFYSDKHIFTSFKRADIGLTTSNEFYVRLKGVSAGGVIDAVNPGPTRLIPSLLDNREEFDATQIYGYDYQKNIWKKLSVGSDGGIFSQKSTLSILNVPALTNVDQYSSVISTTGYGQAVIYLDYTAGAGDASLLLQVQFSSDGINWYDQTYDTIVAGSITSLPRLYTYPAASFTYRIAVPLDDNYMRLAIRVTGGGPFGSATAEVTLGWN